MSSVMADYFPVLSRAVAGLETNTGEARRAVYERARAAIIRQLRGIDPPIAEEDISRERMNLEDAIRRVEADNASPSPEQRSRAASRPTASRSAPPVAVRPNEPPSNDMQPDQLLAETQRPRPSTRADGRPIIRAAGEPADATKPKRSGPIIAVAALALVALVAAGVIGRDRIAGLFGSGTRTADTGSSEITSADTRPGEPGAGGGKDDGRLLDDPAPSGAEPRPPETDVARAPDATAQQPPAESPPAEAAPPQAPPTEPPPAQTQPAAPLVAQRAILYEEGSDQASGEQVDGAILWRTESVSAGQNQPLETALRGEVDIPARGVKATLTIRRNIDATLPASHTIEIQFRLPDNFSNAGVANVPGILMKTDEAARGAPVSGLSVRVTNGFFLIGLSNIDNERTVNEQLLRDRSWIDIPILYDNGRRAVLTLEKGTPGAQAFSDAFAAWQTAAAAGGAPSQP